MTTNVESLSREQLENIVLNQADHIRLLQEQIMFLKKDHETLEEQYDELSGVILAARVVLSC